MRLKSTVTGEYRRERVLVVSGTLILFTGLLALSLLLIRNEGERNRLLLEYEAAQALATLVETIGRQEPGMQEGPVPEDFDRRVLGFGLYSPQGIALYRSGTAPGTLSPERIPAAGGSAALPGGGYNEINSTSLIIIRGLGMGAGRGNSLMGRQARAGNAGRIAFLGYDAEDFLRKRQLYALVRILIPLLLISVLTGVLFLYFRNSAYRMREAAQRRLVQLGEAARTLAHEIKNPLGVIRIQTAMLERKLPPELTRNLGVIREETERLSLLTDRIGDFLRSGNGSPRLIELEPFIRDLAARMPFPVSVGLSDEVRQPSDGRQLYQVLADPDMLRSVVENLLKNAFESMNPGGTEDAGVNGVEVILSRLHGKAVISVLDRGCGIDPGEKDRIFDPFYTTKTKGSGIGLAISRRFTETMKGSITHVSREGGGTEAIVTLPSASSERSRDESTDRR